MARPSIASSPHRTFPVALIAARALLLAALLSSLAAAEDASPRAGAPKPHVPPKPPPPLEPRPPKPRLAARSFAVLKLDPIRAAGAVSAAMSHVRPYLTNPMKLPAGTKWFLLLAALSFWFLLRTLTSIFTFLISPNTFAFNLCCGTALFHASLAALRGPRGHVARLTTAERMPHTMTTFISMLAALWASLKREYWGSILFGGAHFCAFFLDACSHIPGGKQLFKFVLGCYLSFVRWLFALVGVQFSTPSWIAGAMAPPAPPPLAAAGSLSSLLGSLLGSSPSSDAAPRAATGERGVLLRAGEACALPAGAEVLGARAVDEAEAARLRAEGAAAEAAAWRAAWARRDNRTAAEAEARGVWWRCRASGEAVAVSDEVRLLGEGADPTAAWREEALPAEARVEASALLAQMGFPQGEAEEASGAEGRGEEGRGGEGKGGEGKRAEARRRRGGAPPPPPPPPPPAAVLLRVRLPAPRRASWLDGARRWAAPPPAPPLTAAAEWDEMAALLSSSAAAWRGRLRSLWPPAPPPPPAASPSAALAQLRAMGRHEAYARARRQLARQRLAAVRAEQLLALAMAREHQMLTLLRLAAAVSHAEPELAPLLRRLEALAAPHAAAAAWRAAPAAAAAGGAEAEAALLVTARALVPYGAAPRRLGGGEEAAAYSAFLVDELHRLISEAFAPVGGGGWGEEEAAEATEAAEARRRRREAEERARAAAEEKRRRVVEEDRAAAAAELSQIGQSFQEDLQSVKSKFQSLFAKRAAADEEGVLAFQQPKLELKDKPPRAMPTPAAAAVLVEVERGAADDDVEEAEEVEEVEELEEEAEAEEVEEEAVVRRRNPYDVDEADDADVLESSLSKLGAASAHAATATAAAAGAVRSSFASLWGSAAAKGGGKREEGLVLPRAAAKAGPKKAPPTTPPPKAAVAKEAKEAKPAAAQGVAELWRQAFGGAPPPPPPPPPAAKKRAKTAPPHEAKASAGGGRRPKRKKAAASRAAVSATRAAGARAALPAARRRPADGKAAAKASRAEEADGIEDLGEL
ncbi:hypothetical protein AB1Y20_012033 [Prymnesium parvum]|uniref:Uncharacterized protein n=1 Tax=Prymnesium parvum TaxID=97485 RepID=A0AB34IPF7_PRYPA